MIGTVSCFHLDARHGTRYAHFPAMKLFPRWFKTLLVPCFVFFLMAHMHGVKMFRGGKFHSTVFASSRAR